MARSASRLPALVVGAVCCAVVCQLQLDAFVSPAPSLGTPGYRAQSRVIRAASKAEIDAAEKQAKLLVWAAKTAAEQGAPQAATMQAKADEAVRALEALKQQQSGDVTVPARQPRPASPAAMETISATLMSAPVMVEQIAEAERQVKLLKWAAKTTAEKGMPQAGMAQAKYDEAVQTLMRLKEQQEAGGAAVGSTPATPPPVAPTPVVQAAAPAATAPAASGISKAEITEAERQAKLLVWAAKTAAEQGAPQAATMQAKADQAVQALQALKQQVASAPPPPLAPTAPAAAVQAAPAAATGQPSRQELQQAKKDMELLLWAAKTAAAKGMPQAATMKANADAKVQEYERMVEMAAR